MCTALFLHRRPGCRVEDLLMFANFTSPSRLEALPRTKFLDDSPQRTANTRANSFKRPLPDSHGVLKSHSDSGDQDLAALKPRVTQTVLRSVDLSPESLLPERFSPSQLLTTC